MLATQRHGLILDEVDARGAITVGDLASGLRVSEMTIRRDLEKLEKDGKVQRVHGGVISQKSTKTTVEQPFEVTRRKEVRSKRLMAEEAASLVEPGGAIALMGGSSVFALAEQLLGHSSLTIVTNSIPVSDLFSSSPNRGITVYLSGGSRTPTDSLIGNLAVNAFSQFNFDAVFLGSLGMDAEAGFSAPSLAEAETNRAILRQASQSFVLVDHTKWGVRGFSSFASLDEVDALIVSAGLPQEDISSLRKLSRKVIVAKGDAK